MKLPIPREILAQHTAILGKTRSGKSSVMRLLVEDLLERKQPVCIIDPKGDWWGIKLAADGKSAGYPVVIFGGEHADIPIDETRGAEVAQLFATGNRPCLIDLGGWMVAPRTRFWIDFASTLFKLTKGERWLAVDEVHNFCPKGSLKGSDGNMAKALHWTNRLASEGLGKGIAMLFASQRPQKVHNDTLTSAETLIAMRVLHPSDRGAVADWIKGCGNSEGSEVLNSLAQMDRGEGWAWSPEIGFGPKRVKFPLFRTYDSFRAQTVEDTKRLTGWADVNIEDIKAKFAAAIERAKADDPKELRKEIAELKRELATTKRAVVDVAGRTPTAKETRVEVPVLKEGHLARFEKALAGVAALPEKLSAAVAPIVTMGREMTVALSRFQANGHHPKKSGVLSPRTPSPATLSTRPDRQNVTTRVQETRSATTGDLTRPQQRLLDALAWLESVGLKDAERPQLGFLAGASSKSSAFMNNLGALRTAGLIAYPRDGTVCLTDSGRSTANAPDGPLTPEELQRAVLGKVTRPQARILEAVIRVYPESLTREEVGESAEASVNSSAFMNNLGFLRGLGLIDYPGSGQVVACPVLFLQN